MASVVRKLITIISTSILLQPVIEGQYIIYDNNIYENINLPILSNSKSGSAEIFELENNYLDMDLNELENFYNDRQSRNPVKKRPTPLCIAIPRTQPQFQLNNYEYIPSSIWDYDCQEFHGTPSLANINGGICFIPQNRCTTKTINMTIMKREKQINSSWEPEHRNISVGCKCHYLKYGF